jgi:GTPase SAR1 family protein
MAKKPQTKLESWIRNCIAQTRYLNDRTLLFTDEPPQKSQRAAKKAFALVAAEFPQCVGVLARHQGWIDDGWLSALAAEAQHLPKLEWIDFQKTQVGDAGLRNLAAEAKHLQQLRWLNLSSTHVSDTGLVALAAQAQHIPQLEELSFRKTRVGDAGLEALGRAWQTGQLPRLITLDVTNTKVRSVASELLETLSARHILDAMTNGVAVAEGKVVVLGEPEVGKTWLCQRIFLEQIPHERRETHDFELIQPTWRPRVDKLQVGLRVWDFGGQHILHGTHELFLTERSVCLVVLDVTRDLEGNRPSYWLNMVRHFVGSAANVVLVATQCDRPTHEQRLGVVDAERLQHAYRFKSPLPAVELFSAIGREKSHQQAIENLRRAIEDALAKMELHAKGSADLPAIKARVEREMAQRALVSLEDYRSWCCAAGVGDRHSQDVHLRTLHHFGSVFYFGVLDFEAEQRELHSEERPPGQRRLLTARRDSSLDNWLINPHWLKWPVYEVVRASREKAWLTANQIEDAVSLITQQMQLDQPVAGANIVRGVLELTELCLYDPKRGAYFFPRGLPSDSARFLTGWKATHRIDWDWEFFPEAALHRFLVRAHGHDEIRDQAHWRTGAVVESGAASAAIDSKPEEGRVTILLQKGPHSTLEPSAEQLKLVNQVILPRLVDLIGREPKETQCSWQRSPTRPDMLQANDQHQVEGVLRLLRAVNGDVTLDEERFIRAMLSITSQKINGQTERMSYRAWYVFGWCVNNPDMGLSRTYDKIWSVLQKQSGELWNYFGGTKYRPKTQIAFEKAVRRAKQKCPIETLNKENPRVKSSPASNTAGAPEDIEGEKRFGSKS